MEATQTTRQQKIARQIQRDIAEILQKDGKAFTLGSMVTVTTVRVSPDLAYAKVYFSIFPFERNGAVMEAFGLYEPIKPDACIYSVTFENGKPGCTRRVICIYQ